MELTVEIQQTYKKALNNDPNAQYKMYLYHWKNHQDFRANKWLRRAVKSGLAIAQNKMANILAKKYALKWRVGKVRRLYKAAAMQGLADAQYNYAMLFERRRKLSKRAMKKQYEWLAMAADQGHNDAIKKAKRLAEKLKFYDGVIKWATKLFDLGNYEEAMFLAKLYENGTVIPKDDVLATLWYRRASDHKIKDSFYKLGMAYYKGKGVETNEFLAFKWLFEALESGDDRASKTLIDIKMTGKISHTYYKEIGKRLESAAENGDYNAQLYVASQCYSNDEKLGIYWYKRAAEHGTDGEAEYQLGLYSRYADNRKEAIYWYKKSFEKGNYEGVIQLRRLLSDARKYNEAYRYSKIATDHGSKDGYCALAECYYDGCGVERNLFWAREYATYGEHTFLLELISKQGH